MQLVLSEALHQHEHEDIKLSRLRATCKEQKDDNDRLKRDSNWLKNQLIVEKAAERKAAKKQQDAEDAQAQAVAAVQLAQEAAVQATLGKGQVSCREDSSRSSQSC